MIYSRKDLVIALFAVFGLIYVFESSQSSIAAGVEIWDNDTSGWVSDPANGDPIDRGNNSEAIKPQVAIDSGGNVYIAYYQYDGSAYRVFLNRYDGNIVEIWAGSGWTAEFDRGTPIDKMGLPLVGAEPHQEETYGYPIDIAIDNNNVVYIVYRQSASVEDPDQIFLSRYLVDGSEEQVQIWSNTGWNTNLELGSAISHSEAERSTDPRLAVDSINNVVYITYYQAMHHEAHIYLNRHLVVDQQEFLQVWSATDWSDNLDEGTHIDIGGENHHVDPRIAVDASGRVYVAYILVKDLGEVGIGRIYLSRYLNGSNGGAVQIWSDTGWTPDLEKGIPIDTGSESVSGWEGYDAPAWEGGSWNVRIATGSDDIVYVSYHQAVEIAGETHWHVFLNRAIGEDIEIWSDTESFTGWTPNLELGTPIDKRLPHDAGMVSIAIDGNNIPYLSFMQYKGIGGLSYGIHLVRYNGGVVEIWDADTGNWTPELEQGDPLDPLGAGSAAILSELAIDINNTVYLTYIDSQNSAIYLNRYSDNRVEIWDTDTLSWTSNLADGDAIHRGLPVASLVFSSEYGCPPQTMAAKEALYVTYFQQPEGSTQHVYLSRYLCGCFITTATYGSALSNEVDVFRQFRDEYLLTNEFGRAFVSGYYEYSPPLADWIAKHPAMRKIVRIGLYPVLEMSKWFIGENPLK
jgi:hypothetical protein